jgi:hypothetical protein
MLLISVRVLGIGFAKDDISALLAIQNCAVVGKWDLQFTTWISSRADPPFLHRQYQLHANSEPIAEWWLNLQRH